MCVVMSSLIFKIILTVKLKRSTQVWTYNTDKIGKPCEEIVTKYLCCVVLNQKPSSTTEFDSNTPSLF